MVFVVEAGAGLSTATSYISDTDANTYLLQNGGVNAAWTGSTVAQKQEALNSATRYIDATYRGKWKGRKQTSAQALTWPKYGVYDAEGFEVASSSVPEKIRQATAMLGESQLVLLASGSSLLPIEVTSGSIGRSRVKLDVLEEDITYTGGSSAVPRFRLADSIIAEFLRGCGSGRVRLG